MLDNLFKTIANVMPLTLQDKALFESYFDVLTCKRNDILEVQNQKPQHLYFINEGFMRLFYYDNNSDEVTTHLCSPNGFITSFLSFIHEKPAEDNLECITDCELLRITRPKLVGLIEKSEQFKKFSLIIFEQAIGSSQIRANDFATLTAELRYKKLVTEQPQLLHNVPIRYIASYLGIKPQSLSRIRAQMIK
jgi:CRP/FNR family transcriptional regulator, anaerobic regulatory protein